MSPVKSSRLAICNPSITLQARPLLTLSQAGEVESLFRVLANDTRLRLLHEVSREGEICVNDLAAALDMKPQAVSNQLQRLSDKGVLASRREGKNIYYRIMNTCVTDLLDRALCLISEQPKRKTR